MKKILIILIAVIPIFSFSATSVRVSPVRVSVPRVQPVRVSTPRINRTPRINTSKVNTTPRVKSVPATHISQTNYNPFSNNFILWYLIFFGNNHSTSTKK